MENNTHFIVAFKLDGDSEIEYFSTWATNADTAVHQCCDANPEAVWTKAYAPVN